MRHRISGTLRVCSGFLAIFFSLLPFQVLGVDNPNAPDYIGLFEAREKPFTEACDDPKPGVDSFQDACARYLAFLDKELNTAYRYIKSKFARKQQAELKISQRHWLKYRDAEFKLIYNGWTDKEFGSSRYLSHGLNRASLVRARVIQLLGYAYGH